MNPGMRICFLALYGVGPMIALLGLWRRGHALTVQQRVTDWRRLIPTILLPIEWLMPPVLILSGFGEIQVDWFLLRMVGFALSLVGAALLIAASLALGRFFVHEAAVFNDHTLITNGPYRCVRHPIYSGYLALLLGSGLGMLNVYLFLLWPLSLVGILVQAASEEQLLRQKFGRDYECYAERTGQLVPRLWGENTPCAK